MTALLNESINLSQTGLLYNPQLQGADIVKKLFVVRQKQFNSLLDNLLKEKEDSIPQHYLIVGQRGMGKTMLLKRIEVELHNERQYRERFIPILYPEEQYNVKDLAEFWLNTLDALADSLQEEKYPVEMVADIDKTIQELSRKPPKVIAEEAYEYLLNICGNLRRRPVLLIDNIDLVFSGLDNGKKIKTEQWALRKLLCENAAPIVISGGVTLFDSVNNYGMPFYDFFQIQQLYKLDYEEFTNLLINLATITNSDKTVFDSIQKNSSRQRSLLELTGGSPRLTVKLFEQIAKGFSKNIYDDLQLLVDEITPFYKARFEELPKQQQIILDAIALNWDAISLKKLSMETRMQNNQLSPQLMRLVNDGWIETTPAYNAKGNAYFISERFFNIFYLIRNSSRRHKDKVFCLSKFLECFYGKEELEIISNSLLNENIYSSEQMGLHLALSMIKTLKPSTRKKIQKKVFDTFLNNDELCKEFEFSGNNFISEGIAFFESKQYGEAIKYFNKIISENKDNAYAWACKGECLSELKRYEEALVCYDEFTKREQNEATAWIGKGDLLYKMERLDSALSCFDKALEIDNKEYYAWTRKGEILKALKKYGTAVECFDNAIKLKSDDDENLLFNKAFCLMYLKQYEEAIISFSKIIKLNPKNEYYWAFKGEALMLLDRFTESLDCYKQAIKLNPKDNTFWIMTGIHFCGIERYKDAIDAFDKAIELDGNNKNAWNYKAVCLIDTQKYEEALVCLNRAIELEPNNTNAWNNKGYALIELKKFTDAVYAYEKAIEIDPERLLPKFFLSFLYRDKLNEINKAMEIFNSINEEEINDDKNKNLSCYYYLNKALFELYNQNKGLAKEYLLQAFMFFEKEDKIMSIASNNWWAKFGSVVTKLCCGSWFLAILDEKGYNTVLSPYYTAIKALEIEQQDSKSGQENAEIYLKNKAIEISDPAMKIIEKMKKYLS